jgi:hypothetical protein
MSEYRLEVETVTLVDEDGNPTGQQAQRALFPFRRLCSALANDQVEAMVRECLQHRYGDDRCFDLLVSDVKKSVMLMVVSALKQGSPRNALGVIIKQEHVDQFNAALGEPTVDAFCFVAWKGERE